jgi:hypothetical protein
MYKPAKLLLVTGTSSVQDEPVTIKGHRRDN